MSAINDILNPSVSLFATFFIKQRVVTRARQTEI